VPLDFRVLVQLGCVCAVDRSQRYTIDNEVEDHEGVHFSIQGWEDGGGGGSDARAMPYGGASYDNIIISGFIPIPYWSNASHTAITPCNYIHDIIFEYACKLCKQIPRVLWIFSDF
jgi:hypothetical protein